MKPTKEILGQKKEELRRFRERYYLGEGDVIGGLLYMDQLKDDIRRLEEK